MKLFSTGFETGFKLVFKCFETCLEIGIQTGFEIGFEWLFLFVIGFETGPIFERSRVKIGSKMSQQGRGLSLDHAATRLVKSRAQIKIKYETERYDIMV